MSWMLILLCLIESTIGNIHPDPRIVNGIPINANQYPWVATLRLQTWGINFLGLGKDYKLADQSFCTGSLINLSPPIILTAAHCIDSFEYNSTTKRILDTSFSNDTNYDYFDYYENILYVNINRTNNDVYEFNVTDSHVFNNSLNAVRNQYQTLEIKDLSEFYIHPQYNASQTTNGYDVALIIFKNESVILGQDQLPTLPTIQLNQFEPCCTNNEQFMAIGYGSNHTDGPHTETLEKTTFQYKNASLCIDMVTKFMLNYNFSNEELKELPDNFNITKEIQNIAENEMIFCVLGDNTDVCPGDSGGPLFKIIHDKPQIFGVASFIVGDCNDGNPTYYTSISHFVHWIDKTIDSVVYGITWSPTMEPTATPTALTATMVDNYKPRFEEDDTWFIIGIVFICFFGLSLIVIAILLYKLNFTKKNDGDNKVVTQKKKGGYYATAQDAEID